MANFIDTVIKNPILIENAKEALSRYWIPALVATLGTGGVAAYIAGNKKRVGESPSARRKRIIRSTLLPTLAAALGSAGLIGASALWNTDADSYVGTGKVIDENPFSEVTKAAIREITKPPEPTFVQKYIKPDMPKEPITGAAGVGLTGIGLKYLDTPTKFEKQWFKLSPVSEHTPMSWRKAVSILSNNSKKVTGGILNRSPRVAALLGGYQLGNLLFSGLYDEAANAAKSFIP